MYPMGKLLTLLYLRSCNSVHVCALLHHNLRYVYSGGLVHTVYSRSSEVRHQKLMLAISSPKPFCIQPLPQKSQWQCPLADHHHSFSHWNLDGPRSSGTWNSSSPTSGLCLAKKTTASLSLYSAVLGCQQFWWHSSRAVQQRRTLSRPWQGFLLSAWSSAFEGQTQVHAQWQGPILPRLLSSFLPLQWVPYSKKFSPMNLLHSPRWWHQKRLLLDFLTGHLSFSLLVFQLSVGDRSTVWHGLGQEEDNAMCWKAKELNEKMITSRDRSAQ